MKILVCTDGSPGSLAVLPHAGRFASAVGAEIVLTRVLDPRVDAASVVSPSLEAAVTTVQTSWEAGLREVLSAAGLSGSVMVPRRAWGKEVADAIHLAADETEAAMVAISSRGSGAVRHALFGSVALGVISRADLPVMTLAGDPPMREASGPYHIVVTSDGSADAKSIFPGISALLIPGKTKVTIVEVATMKAQESEAEAIERTRPGIEALLARVTAGVEASTHVRVVPAGAAIDLAVIAAADSLGADAIASATHGHSAQRRLIAGSTALGIVAKAQVPVILVKSTPTE